MTIEARADVREYFRERVVTALDHRSVDVDEVTEFYLVDLLARHVCAAMAEVQRPFVVRLAEAMESPDPRTRFRRFREMGDAALYLSGFFPDHLRSRGISRDYVVAMGEQAYGRARQLAGFAGQGSELAFASVYARLSSGFDAYVAVLDEVREATAMQTPQDVVRLYERWRESRSPRLAERLRAVGLFPQWPGEGGELH